MSLILVVVGTVGSSDTFLCARKVSGLGVIKFGRNRGSKLKIVDTPLFVFTCGGCDRSTRSVSGYAASQPGLTMNQVLRVDSSPGFTLQRRSLGGVSVLFRGFLGVAIFRVFIM